MRAQLLHGAFTDRRVACERGGWVGGVAWVGREYPGRVMPGAVAWLVRRGVRPGLGGGGPEWCVPWGLTGVGTDSTPPLCLSSLSPGGAGHEVGTLAGPGQGRAQLSPITCEALGVQGPPAPLGCCGGFPMQLVAVWPQAQSPCPAGVCGQRVGDLRPPTLSPDPWPPTLSPDPCRCT